MRHLSSSEASIELREKNEFVSQTVQNEQENPRKGHLCDIEYLLMFRILV